ncbi:MAG TPA: hypothetical protein VHL31_24425 [Geminicoccus sp.]|uniref:hypothetical protein n=1 Tax=Geminicoccus sp. TaxID=2024832 RepID=UPI002E2EF00B|nr:hypothetical protein [Geminicoccus sp.]HEX2529426.1 hypothetical protein [Geminicoccus sp.]
MPLNAVLDDLTIICDLISVVQPDVVVEEQLGQLEAATRMAIAQNPSCCAEHLTGAAGQVVRMIALEQGMDDDTAQIISSRFMHMISGHGHPSLA